MSPHIVLSFMNMETGPHFKDFRKKLEEGEISGGIRHGITQRLQAPDKSCPSQPRRLGCALLSLHSPRLDATPPRRSDEQQSETLSQTVGVASAMSRKVGAWNLSETNRSIFFRSPFAIPPMGLISALLQSYFVMYPRSASSTFPVPSTSRKPF
jgi:hypothetical protein